MIFYHAAGSFHYKNHLALFHPHFCASIKITDLRALLTTRLGLQKLTFNFLTQNLYTSFQTPFYGRIFHTDSTPCAILGHEA